MNDEIRFVAGMSLLRLISGTIEISAALLMLHFRSLETAFRINGLLGLVGPTVLILVSSLGVIGLAGHIAPTRLAFIVAGVIFILIGARS